jgi:hypothetical protein
LDPSSHVGVLKNIASSVVVWIIDDTSSSAETGDFFGSLNTISTTGETTSSDSNIEEGAVIGASVKGGGVEWKLSVLGEVHLPEFFDLSGTRSTADVER